MNQADQHRNARRGIVTGGTWCADHNKLVENWPDEEGLVKILGEEVRGGGSACNLAIDMKRLDPDLPVATMGLLGDDADGQLLLQQAASEKLDHSKLTILVGHRTTFTDAFTSQDSARRTHLFHPGVSETLNPTHFNFSDTQAQILHLGLPGIHAQMDSPWEGDANGWVTVLKNAKRAGLKTNLELCSIAPDQLRELVVPCLEQLNYLIVNDYEIAAVAGKPTDHGQETNLEACIANAHLVLSSSSLDLVIVHFPHGAVAITAQGDQVTCPSVNMPTDKIAGTNGAGDAFAAGALYGLHQNWELDETLNLAHASAAASMRHIGTTDALTGWADCLQLANQYGWRNPLA